MNRFVALLVVTLCGILGLADASATSLDEDFAKPPRDAKLRAYWWWLNGNVTKASITRDLEQMAAQGFGGALICDAGGAEQRDNDQVPHGPDFFSPEWRELYRHALAEADRLGLEMSLNILSGWNLGGPMVPAEDAPKKLVWSETLVKGPATLERVLPLPQHRPELYRDVIVVAYPVAPLDVEGVPVRVQASTERPDQPARLAADGSEATFWVSRGVAPGEGPTAERPEWLGFDFGEPVALSGLRILGRPGYGPREAALHASADGKTWRPVASFKMESGKPFTATLKDLPPAAHYRIVITSSFDPREPEQPRNVQVVEVALLGADGADLLAAGRPGGNRLQNWAEKALIKPLHSSAPETAFLLEEPPATPGEEETRSDSVVELTRLMAPDGTLRWEVPEGTWEILRIGYTLNDHCRVSTHSEGWAGYALDPFDAKPFNAYWDAIVEPLIADAGPLAGETLRYLHTDSWEVEVANWTPGLREQFQERRGYDLLPFLPVLAGKIVDDRQVSNRFLHDFRKTMGELAIDNHYRHFAERAHRHGLLIHPESGGPHAVPIDSLRSLGHNDAPMSEFWARSWQHRVTDEQRFFVKQPASAAHTYGRRLVLAEGFTTIGPHWQETLWDNLKPSFDRALCEGLNLLYWHAFTCSPAEMGLPGQEYFAGTHFNPNSTWWTKSGPFLAYLNRCQALLQRGLFVADALYYYGDHVPNFAQLKASDPAGVLPGYDYDVATEEVLLTRLDVQDGRLILPDGMSYHVLVLPDHPGISLPVLRKVRELVEAGATVLGPRPSRTNGLEGFPASDEEVARLAEELWGADEDAESGVRQVGKGRVAWGKTARELFQSDRLAPDFAFDGADEQTTLDYIHRRDGDADIYFVANRTERPEEVQATFRVSGKAPELWDAVTGQARPAAVWSQAEGCTTLPLELDPYGSVFVVFRKPADAPPATTATRNSPRLEPRHELKGPWAVAFDPEWGGPESVEFPRLVSWTERPEPGIRFYSGTATYAQSFDLPEALRAPGQRVVLDLGNVRELAQVRLNGQDLGILWTSPFQGDVTDALQPEGNRLEIEVVNFWPNRIIGDQSLPEPQRRTRTNIRQLKADTPLMVSGLLGPVRLLTETPAGTEGKAEARP